MSDLVCMFCERPPEDPPLGSDAFVVSADGEYHERCLDLHLAQRALEAEQRVRHRIVDATISWVAEHHHYGDIPPLADADRDAIIADAFRRGLSSGGTR